MSYPCLCTYFLKVISYIQNDNFTKYEKKTSAILLYVFEVFMILILNAHSFVFDKESYMDVRQNSIAK